MAKKVLPRDKSRVEHAARRGAKKQGKAFGLRRAPQQAANRNRRRSTRAAPQKAGIAGFVQRLLGRFRRQ
jgi:hypothetical protein